MRIVSKGHAPPQAVLETAEKVADDCEKEEAKEAAAATPSAA